MKEFVDHSLLKNPIPVFIIYLLIFSGCTVGTKVSLTADSVDYPVSMAQSFYSETNTLILPHQYEVVQEFGFEFTKWGVTSPLNINANEDLSDVLNEIIEKYQGDAITDLSISALNPPTRNNLLLFAKTVALSSALVFTTATIINLKMSYGAAAAGSAAVYLFTPAAAKVRVEGRVVRLIHD